MDVQKAIEKRFSCREFSSKKVRWDHVLEAIDAASKAPFAGNLCNLKFIIVQNQNIKNKITKNCQQDWVADAPILVVVCSDEIKPQRNYYDRGKIYSRQQAGAAIENFLLRITELKLGSCWVGAYIDELVKQCLKIPEHINIEAILPVGYPKKTSKQKQSEKTNLENCIYWETWSENRKPTRIKDPDS